MSYNSKAFQNVSNHSTNATENYLKTVSSQKVAAPQSDVLPPTIHKALTKTLIDNKEGFESTAKMVDELQFFVKQLRLCKMAQRYCSVRNQKSKHCQIPCDTPQ